MKTEHLPWGVCCWCWNPPCVLRWLSLPWPPLHEWSLTFPRKSCWSQIRTKNNKKTSHSNTQSTCNSCQENIFSRHNYLDKRAQVVLQALLVTSGDYMYDHTESMEQDSHTHCTVQCYLITLEWCKIQELTAGNWQQFLGHLWLLLWALQTVAWALLGGSWWPCESLLREGTKGGENSLIQVQ